MKKIRKHIIFYGCVQGVGFRYTASHLARAYGLTGWVKNEWDGTVVMEIQGDGEALELMLDKLHQGRFIRIERMEAEELQLERESSFRVR